MRDLIESLGKFIAESKAKKVRKRRTRKRASEADKMMAKQIGAAMKARISEIPRMLPRGWVITQALALDKQILGKRGEAYIGNELEADYGYPIGISDELIETATADFGLSCYPYGNGDGVVCSVTVDNFSPDESDPGVVMVPVPPRDGITIEAEWKRKKKAFDPSKNLWPLIKTVMKELKKQMPEYDELDPDYGKSETERYFGSESAYWRWKEG